jgi:protein phosphatase
VETPATPLRLDIGSATSAGRVRKHNEDSYLVQHLAWGTSDDRHDSALLVVADGMGGHAGGARASGMVVRGLGSALACLLGGGLTGPLPDAPGVLLGALQSALQEVNRAVYRQAQTEPGCKGMGATTAAVLLWDNQALVSHVGDCRVYHQRAGRLTQVTRDQTLVARMVDLGKLTPREALQHPARNEVAQAVGKQPDLSPSRHQIPLLAGDWLLIASDGLQAHLDHVTLQQEITKAPPSASQFTQQLVELAERRGGSDNCTILGVRCCA